MKLKNKTVEFHLYFGEVTSVSYPDYLHDWNGLIRFCSIWLTPCSPPAKITQNRHFSTFRAPLRPKNEIFKNPRTKSEDTHEMFLQTYFQHPQKSQCSKFLTFAFSQKKISLLSNPIVKD
jgi:hypothetical protein